MRLSPKAQGDLDDIWEYTRRRWGEQQATAYVVSFRTVLELVDRHPGLARKADDVRPGLRKYQCGSHVLYFRPTNEAIDVIRILHRSMDVERHF